MRRKTCIIIGNGDLQCDFSHRIDSADYVLRFNRPRLLDGWSGTRTDRMMICNAGKSIQLMLKDPDFLNSKFIKNTKDIVFVYHPSIIQDYFKKPSIISRILKKRRMDWTGKGIDILGQKGKPVTVLPPEFYFRASAEIGISGNGLYRCFPSTGYLGIWDTLQRLPTDKWQIQLCGFSWQGWKGHNWDMEKRWITSRTGDCSLSVIEEGNKYTSCNGR